MHPISFKIDIDRSSHQRCSMMKGVLRNFTKFTGKHLCQSLFFNNVAGLRSSTLLKKRLSHRSFPVNFVKFLRTPFLTEQPWWQLLMLKEFHVQMVYWQAPACALRQLLLESTTSLSFWILVFRVLREIIDKNIALTLGSINRKGKLIKLVLL